MIRHKNNIERTDAMQCSNDINTLEKTEVQKAGSSVMVIFGASGDLTKRKLIPAIYNLAKENLLSDKFAVIGVARSKMSSEEFREKMKKHLTLYASEEIDPAINDWVCSRLHYLSGDLNSDDLYKELREKLKSLDANEGTGGNAFYYLATSPQFFSGVIQKLGVFGLLSEAEGNWRRIIVEKPFGRDLSSAKALNKEIAEVMDEKQIYRIDHYLGKETVQNIMAFRFANGIFEPIWNHRYIDHVQITVAEQLGVEERGRYYENAGALRDMLPNHIFQLISLTAMEPPISFEPDAVRDEQAKVLNAIQPMTPEEVLKSCVRGQYREGTLDDLNVPGYRSETGVDPDSSTETFMACKLFVENWRWAEVPFYVRTGKRMPQRATEIAIQFKKAPFMLFRETTVDQLTPNRLVIRVQPDEGISLSFGAKIPGPIMSLGTVNMNFQYKDYFGSTPSTGYERLLYDCMLGDATLFQRADMTEAGWRVVEPILDLWKALPAREFPNYTAGSWGPTEAEELLSQDGRTWSKCI